MVRYRSMKCNRDVRWVPLSVVAISSAFRGMAQSGANGARQICVDNPAAPVVLGLLPPRRM